MHIIDKAWEKKQDVLMKLLNEIIEKNYWKFIIKLNQVIN